MGEHPDPGGKPVPEDSRLEPHLALRDAIATSLPPGLQAHIDRVARIAGDLADRHGLDVALTQLMAQAHDVLRAVPPAELLRRAEAEGLAIDRSERSEPVLLHGPLGAIELERRYGLTDQRVLHAVWWHTPGHPAYSPEAWAMFIADKIDPHKVDRWPALEEVRQAAQRSLHEAARVYLDLVVARVLDAGTMLHPMAVHARNALLDRGTADGRERSR